MLQAVDYILVISIGIGISYSIISLALLIRDKRRVYNKNGSIDNYPGITVMKPLKGLDDALESNLRSFFEMNYPKFELIFGIQETNDPAIDLVKKLQNEYLKIPSRLVVNTARYGLNPKIGNLINIYPYANHDYFVISDSNVNVAPNYLNDFIDKMQVPDVGLVTSTIRGVGGKSTGAILENLHLNTFIAGSVCAVRDLFDIPITIGKSMCFRRETIKKLGGLETFSSYLAEDFLLGDAIKKLGMRVIISNHRINSINTTWSVSRFINRHFRWATMRRHINLFNYTSEIFSNPILHALILLGWRSDLPACIFFATVTVFKILLDIAMARVLGADLQWYHYSLIPLKDALIGGVWLAPFFHKIVVWRGNKFRINKNTYLTPITEPSPGISMFSYFLGSYRFVLSTGRRTIAGTRRIIAYLGSL